MREILQIHNEEEERDYGRLYRPKKDVKVIKKDGSREDFNVGKVVNAIGKSAYRALTDFSEEEIALALDCGFQPVSLGARRRSRSR